MRAALVLLLVASCDGREQHGICTCDAPPPIDAGPCTTRITYGSTWIRPTNHPADFDDVDGFAGWDGRCTDDGANSFATLSNGWKPYFTGHQACAIAIDTQGGCGYERQCMTRITYALSWIQPAGHGAQ